MKLINYRVFYAMVFACLCAFPAFADDFYFNSKQYEPKSGEWHGGMARAWSKAELEPGRYVFSADIKLTDPMSTKSRAAIRLDTGIPDTKSIIFQNGKCFDRFVIPFTIAKKRKLGINFSGMDLTPGKSRIVMENATISKWDANPADGNFFPLKKLTVREDGKALLGWTSNPNQTVFSSKGQSPETQSETVEVTVPAKKTLFLYSPRFFLSKDKIYTASIYVRGKGTVRLQAVNRSWRKVKEWKNGTYVEGRHIPAGPKWKRIEFRFRGADSNAPFSFVIVLTGGPFELSKPVISAQTMEKVMEQAMDSAKGSSSRMEDKKEIKLDFDSDMPKKLTMTEVKTVNGIKGNGGYFSGRSRLSLPLDFNTQSGTLSFWLKLDHEPGYDQKNDQSIWMLENTDLNSRFHHVRFCFGSENLGYPNKLFPGEWHYVVYAWDPNGLKLYIDGRISWNSGKAVRSGNSPVLVLGRNSQFPSFHGVLDDITLRNYAVNDEQVKKCYAAIRPVTPFLIDYSGLKGKSNLYRIGFDNDSPQTVSGAYKVMFKEENGRVLAENTLAVTAPPNHISIKKIFFSPPENKDYLVTIDKADGADPQTFRIAILDDRSITESMKPGDPHLKLIDEIDLCKSMDRSNYRDDGKCHVVSSSAGTYRETEGKVLNSGFAVRFSITHPGQPYWVEIEYPDDSDRTFYASVGEIIHGRLQCGFIETIGVITGMSQPISNRMQTKRLLFWPDNKELAIVFGSYRNRLGEKGPAVSRIRIYQNEGPLPKLQLASYGRSVMIWNEDPTMPAYSWFNQYHWNKETSHFDFWREKYRRMVKYTRFIGWKQWCMLGYDYMGDNTLGDRRLISSSYGGVGGFLPGHLDMFAVTAEREKIPFYISLNPLVEWSNGTQAGFSLQLGSGRIQYDFFAAAAEGKKALAMFSSDDSLTRVRKLLLNPLHPEVRALLKKLMLVYQQKFGVYSQFAGIDYQGSQLLYFPGAEAGYGDYTVGLFQSETGTGIPAFTGVKRFSKRHAWLKEHAWKQWIDWRCSKISELVSELAACLPDGKKFIFRVCLTLLESRTSDLDKGILPDLKAHYREQGIDFDQLRKIKNVILMPSLEPNYSRIHGKADERTLNFSDNLADLWTGASDPAVLIFQPSLEIYNGIAQNFPIKDLWKCRMFVSFSTPLPNNNLALENLAWVCAAADPRLINHGWWGNPETGAYLEFRKFYQAFSAIPDRVFRKAPGVNDPVTVRYSGDYIYLVNMAYYPMTPTLRLTPGVLLTDAVTGKPVDANSVELNGLELRVLKASKLVETIEVVQNVPEKEIRRLASVLRKVGSSAPAAYAAELFQKKRYAATEFALQHRSIIAKLRELPYEVVSSLKPDGRLELSLKNRSSRELKLEIRLKEHPAAWNANRSEIGLNLKSGEARIVSFDFSGADLKMGRNYDFKLEIGNGGESKSYEFHYQPFYAKYAVDVKNMTNSQWFHLDSGKGRFRAAGAASEQPFKAKFAVNWNASGIYLEVKVADRDFRPPPTELEFWKHDSLVVYFDLGNDAVPGDYGYNENDLKYRVAAVGKQIVVADGTKNRVIRKNFDASVTYSGGELCYRIFFPASELRKKTLMLNDCIGFSLEIINLLAADHRVVLSTQNAHPSVSPGVWADLYLEK